MKIILFGGNGTIGKHVTRTLRECRCEVIQVGRNSGDFIANFEDPKSVADLYKKLGSFDAVVSAAGEVAFAPLATITSEQWSKSLQSKLLGQINLVQQALPYIHERGSFTLVSGVLSDEPILSGVVATTLNRAIEGYVMAAACELPKGLRINVVSPTVLEDSMHRYADFFPGFIPVAGEDVAQAYKKSVMGIQTGQIFRVF